MEYSKYQLALLEEVAHGTGNVIVQARAGSGKTTTIVESLKVVPTGKSILLCAFNKQNERTLSQRAPANVETRTLHSIGYRAVRYAWGPVDVNADKVKQMIDMLVPSAPFEARTALSRLVSLSKNLLAETRDQIIDLAFQFNIETDQYTEEELADFTLILLKDCATRSTQIDYDDMIWLPKILGLKLIQYDYVFVDETQDLNACQLWLTQHSCKAHGRIIAIGDDRQAIYAWRGADKDAMERMRVELSAKVMHLSICYRCPKNVIALARTVVPDIEAYETNPDGVINTISADDFMSKFTPAPKDFVLSRTNAPLMPICLALLRRGIPATVAGREVANSLKSLIKRSRADNIPELVEWLNNYRVREIEKLHKHKKNGAMEVAINDKVDTVIAISDGCVDPEEIMERIDSIFSDTDTTGKVICSTVHKAKGLEANTVWMMIETFKPGRTQEETNIYYVAVTRSQNTLNIVRGKK